MEFRLTDQQLELQAAMRAFCDDLTDISSFAHDVGDLRLGTRWARLAALDVFRIATSTTRGGLGLGIVDAAVVIEVLGTSLAPGPLVWSTLASRFVAEFASGELVVGGLEVGGLEADIAIVEPVLVEHARSLDALLVVRPDGVDHIDPRDVGSFDTVEPTDPLTPVSFARGVPHGRRVGDAVVAAELRVVGTVLTAAQLVGLADRAVAAGVAYTSEREQFGRPVGSFQAIKHLLADCYVRTSLARSATYAAAALCDDPDVGDRTRAASAAKLLAADAAIRNARTCIQVHGGMGFTWEMVPHYLLKRAWVLEHTFGTRRHHEEALASALEQEMVP